MAAGVAADPDAVAFDHGVPKGLRRPVTEFGRELSERDVPFWRLLARILDNIARQTDRELDVVC
jgi:hypothetical protein